MMPLSGHKDLQESAAEALRELISNSAVEIKQEGFTLASGRRSNLYIDLRRITQDPRGINLVGSLVLEKIMEIAPQAKYVGGLETASIPIATAVSLLSFGKGVELKAFWVRKKEKDHGLQNKIEGNLAKGGAAVIIDDTVTTGGSSIQAVAAVREYGASVIQAIAIVDRGARKTFENEKIPFFSFFTENDFLSPKND